MPGNCLCMLAGAYALVLLGDLPSTAYLASLGAVAVVCLSRVSLHKFAFFLLGLSLHWFAALQVSGDYLLPALEGETLRITAVVDDFPIMRGDLLRFTARPVDNGELPARIRLSWHEPPSLPTIGDTWALQVRLRRPRGFANPHSFDYEAWLLRQKIGATGYVLAGEASKSSTPGALGPAIRFRRDFVDRVQALLPDDDATAVLLAITVGARHGISRPQWERFAVSGVTHLMAISGLHIGLAAAAAFSLLRFSAATICRHANLRDLATLAAILVALTYAQVSGFAVPAQRAAAMAVLVAFAVLLRRRTDAAWVLAVTCVIVIASDPITVLAPGFQLSFAAVALLTWHSRFTRRNATAAGFRLPAVLVDWFLGLWRLQVMLLLGLFPLLATLFGRVSWLAVPVNILALPVFSLVTVPAALAGMLLGGLAGTVGDLLLTLAHSSIRLVLTIVTWAADRPGANLALAGLDIKMSAAACLVAAGALLPRFWPGRHVAWIALLAVVLYRPPPPPVGCFDVHVLDVGQGLSAVVRTARHAVVYDTGPAFRSGSDTGQLVILPFLRKLRLHDIDLLVISHADLDHAGGAASLWHSHVVQRMLVGESLPDLDAPAELCEAGQSWRWDGVRFSIIHPLRAGNLEGNNASCVLSISAGSRAALLTGDIESGVEKALVERGVIGRVDLVTVPHHGSRTSSSQAFVDATGAGTAVVASGYGNRWGLPKDDVRRRWQRSGARFLATAHSGAVSQRLCRRGAAPEPREERMERRRYWRR